MNGYFTRIYQTLLTGTTLYKKQKRTKVIKKIKEIINKDISFLEQTIKDLKHSRDCSGHPNPYQINFKIFEESEVIKKSLRKVYSLLKELLEVSDEIILREKMEQKKWLENQSRKIVFSKNQNVQQLESKRK